jgi:hypothetical protein
MSGSAFTGRTLTLSLLPVYALPLLAVMYVPPYDEKPLWARATRRELERGFEARWTTVRIEIEPFTR